MRLYNYIINEAIEQLKDWKSYVNNNPMLKNALKIMNSIEKKGYKVYIVGGSVRDIILGIEPKDIDICTNCPPDELGKMFKLHPVGKSGDFGIWVINMGGYSYEIAQFRKESYEKPKYVRKIIK